MWGRYRKAKKGQKGQLLDEIEAVTGMHRKSIIRLLNGQISRKKRKRERGRTYGAEVEDAVRVIARSLDYPCAERLQPNLVWMAKHLAAHQELRVREETLEKLEQISCSTVKRTLKRVGRSEPKIATQKPKRRQRAGIRKGYAMRKIPWTETEAGHFEVDLVHHCGEAAIGEFVHTIQMVDVASGWCEITAVMGRSYRVMQDGFAFILSRLPFPVLEIHPDNGSEFFNKHLIRFWKESLVHAQITRSRPYQKNDNRFVEENNHSLIRAYVGHDRFDTRAQLKVLRQLYDHLWLYHNFFQPVMRVQEKIYLNELQYQRKFDQAQTPFDRLIHKQILDDAQLAQLQALRAQTNPMALRYQIDDLLAQLLSLPVLDKSKTVNIFETLIQEADPSVTLSIEPTLPFR
ncbi:MAG: hypothetical protein MUO40_10990 [Anaerolineaceae bacterium]|nr:hypothetical protein [Anaerolineaceae bacterium]